MVLTSTPKGDGFTSCGEFEPHQGTIMMFPERPDIWRNNAVNAQNLIIDIANIIINYEQVFFCVKPHLVSLVEKKLDSRVQLILIEYDDIWARDIAPNFVVKNNEIRSVCWGFNSWGGVKDGAYYPWDKDAAFAKTLSDILGIKKYIVDNVVLEGGAVIVDGQGTLFTTQNVLLNKNRNPSITLSQMEKYLCDYFCAEKIIWFNEGLVSDETDGHIDNICSFVKPNEVCLAWTDNEKNPQNMVLQRAYDLLVNSQNSVGSNYVIHKLPIPVPQFLTAQEEAELIQKSSSTNRVEGFQLVPSYLNYYLFNSALLFPAFGCEEDSIAYHMIKQIYPEREVIQMDCREPLIGGGGFHCILHEIPNTFT